MTALKRPKAPAILYGASQPRIAPPTPARSDLDGLRAESARLGLVLMPWQECAGRYLTATTPEGGNLYREVCIVVARQNGKTTIARPLIVRALRLGKRVMHIAQSRELPRDMFRTIADGLSSEPDLFPKRRGKTVWPRFGAGQEEIILANGGAYRIAASRTGGSRGWTNDLVVIDELREMESFDVIAAAEPTILATGGQLVYFSNAGSDTSVVLNAARDRAGRDPGLAYLEWSAAPDRTRDDVEGWREANPAMGHNPHVLASLESLYRASELSGNPGKFETEHLCRWVATDSDPFVDAGAWAALESSHLGIGRRVFMGVAVDPGGTRASAALAWRRPDRSIALTIVENGTGSPLDADLFGERVRDLANERRALMTGFDPATDAGLAKYLRRGKAITAREYANASSTFVRLVEGGRLVWSNAGAVTDDLAYTTRKESEETGAFAAVRSNEDRPITAVLAAIRAVWLAAEPSRSEPRVY